jgi:hypothetical protein
LKTALKVKGEALASGIYHSPSSSLGRGPEAQNEPLIATVSPRNHPPT